MKYLEGEELTAEEINRGLKAGIANGQGRSPVFCGSAASNVGVRAVHGRHRRVHARPDRQGRSSRQRPDGDEVTLTADATGPLAVFVFKTVADPYVGKISYFRVFSGMIRGDSRVYSLPSGTEERVEPGLPPARQGATGRRPRSSRATSAA